MTRIINARHALAACFTALPAAAFTGSAWAQALPPVGSIPYVLAGSAQSVPALAPWGLGLLSLLMVPLAWRLGRSHRALLGLGASGLLGAALLATAGWSAPAVAQGAPGNNVLLDSPTGGTADIPYVASLDSAFSDFMADYEVRNTAEQALLITGVTLKPGHTDRDPMQTPHCVTGLTLAPGAVCHLLVSKPH